jgi:hypothetical protein
MTRGTYDRLMSGAATAERLDKRDREGERDRVIAQAVSDTKIEPSRVEHWQRKWDGDPEGTRHLLTAAFDKGGLAPGVVPVDVMGSDRSLEDTSSDAYPAEWLPEVQQREQQRAGGVTTDG